MNRQKILVFLLTILQCSLVEDKALYDKFIRVNREFEPCAGLKVDKK